MLKKVIALSIAASGMLIAANNINTSSILKGTVLEEALNKKLKVNIKDINKDFWGINIKENGRKSVVFLTKDKKYIIIGRVIDAKTGAILNPLKINKEVVNNGVSFKMGSGKKVVYLVTDPECPFCRKLESMIKPEKLKEYTVNIILFPLPFHKYARNMSYYILAGKDNADKIKRYKEVLSGNNKWRAFNPTNEEKAKLEKILQKAKQATMELGTQGTPSIYDKDFNPQGWDILTK